MTGSIVKNDYQDMGADIQAEYAMLKKKYPEAGDAEIMQMISAGEQSEENSGGDQYYVDRARKGVTMAEKRGTNTGENLATNMGMTSKFSPELMQIYNLLNPAMKAEMAALIGGDVFGDEESADEIAQGFAGGYETDQDMIPGTRAYEANR